MLPNPFLKGRSGIYGIRSLDTGKIYVGRTRCMFQRCKQYLNAFHMNSEKHINDYLRNSFNKYGVDRFEFFPLEFCDEERTPERELHWMDTLSSCEKGIGYNLRRDSEGSMEVTTSTSAKISARLKKEWAEGQRDGHAQKMRDKWASDQKRREKQGEMFSRIKTKWIYDITFPDGTVERGVFYSRLKELGLTNAQHEFWKKKKDVAYIKGHIVSRTPSNIKRKAYL